MYMYRKTNPLLLFVVGNLLLLSVSASWLYAQPAGNSKQFYVVIAGVSVYNNPSANLVYADTDATEFYKQMRSMGIPEANITLLTNQNATRSNIIQAMESLYPKARSADEIIFYFSGHGDKGFFLPHDLPNLLYHADVKTAFKKSKAATKLIFADACFSGSIKALPTQAAMPQTEADTKTYYKDLASGGVNVAVFVSSRNNQVSKETSLHKGGIFTYYLLHAFKGKADLDADKLVTLYETYKYVSDNVKRDTYQEQIPVMFGKFNPTLPIVRVK